MSHLGERLSAFIDGELSHAQRDRVLAHLARCEPCRVEAAALRMLKRGFNAALDGQTGIQELAGDATMLFYMTEEAQEGRDAFKEKRKPNYKKFPRRP